MIVNFPPGFDPHDPRLQRALQDVIDNFHKNPNRFSQKEMFDNPNYVSLVNAQTASVLADIRQVDTNLFLNALKEIRLALSNPAIEDGDKGSTERPPVKSSFDEVNSGKLQEAYLNVLLRYVKYIDTTCEEIFEFCPPNSLVKAKEVKKSKKKTL